MRKHLRGDTRLGGNVEFSTGVLAAPFNARRRQAHPNLRGNKTAGGEEVFIPLTQKNLTTGAGVNELGAVPDNKNHRMPKEKEKINGKISRGRLTS